MKLTITGYSTALFSTWYFVEELGLLLDAGDGVTAALLQKSRKIDNVFISHADRDHLTGLLQLNQLNAREGFPRIFYPFDSGSFPAMEAFSGKFDPHVTGTTWHPLKEGASTLIKDGIYVQAIGNNHVKVAPGVYKSFGYQVYEVKNKLKAAFSGLPQEQIRQLIAENGKEHMTEPVRTNILTYSGDTPVDDMEKWNNTRILIHEATFLEQQEENERSAHRNKHSHLEEVLRMVAQLNVEILILGHFSSRYSKEEIDERIKALCREVNIKIPVFRVLPGQTHRNILQEDPVY